MKIVSEFCVGNGHCVYCSRAAVQFEVHVLFFSAVKASLCFSG